MKEKIMGFTISQKHDKKWYAGKRIAKKLYWIYLGKDTQGAEKKIKEYCSKRGLEPDKHAYNNNNTLTKKVERLESIIKTLTEKSENLKKQIIALTSILEKLEQNKKGDNTPGVTRYKLAIENKVKALGSRRELARQAGVSISTISDFLNGKIKNLKQETIDKIANVEV